MLPLRISLQGFMSYRDHTTFDFEGARLWMLAGENGAGKSTVFDAFRFALFGSHRGGKQKPEQLIHHEAQRLVVEVELRLGEERYKLRRTLGREGARPTWDVSRRVEGAWESVAGTGMSSEYNRWIGENIGLTDEAFCASVYLSQGRADAILNADADARYELLSQLVDLEAYEKWHAHADARRGAARAEMLDARKRWETAPAPHPERLLELRERAKQLGAESVQLAEQVSALESARADAARWEEWSGLLNTLEREVEAKRELLRDEETINRDFARWQHLTQHRGTVESSFKNARRREELAQKLSALRPQQSEAEQKVAEEQKREQEVALALEEASRAWSHASEAWSARVQRLAQIEPQRAAIERRAQLRKQRGEVQRQTEAFEPDLNAQRESTEKQREAAREQARALPIWRRFVSAKSAYTVAFEQEKFWRGRHTESLSRRDELAHAGQEARFKQEEAASALREAVAAQGRLDERAQALETRRSDFAKVEGEARCHFCGQELSPQHRAAELERLAQAAQLLETEHIAVTAEYEAARASFRGAEATASATAGFLAEADKAVATAEIEVRGREGEAMRERSLALVAWDELGDKARALFGLQDFNFEEGLSTSLARPTADDLRQLETAGARVGELETRLTVLQQQIRAQERVEAELARINGELVPLLGSWSDAQVEEWHTQARTLEREVTDAKTRVEETQSHVQTARTEQTASAKVLAKARRQNEDLLRQIGPLQGELQAVERSLESSLNALQEATSLQTPPHGDEARALRDAWEHELKALERRDIAARHRAVSEARTRVVESEREHAFYSRQIAGLPPLAQRPRAQVEAEWQKAQEALQITRAEHDHVGDAVKQLERESQEREVLETRLQERSVEHDRWDELARLLGPHQLQRHLLRRAEAAIVREANGVLEAISGGTLRLELVPDSDENAGNKRPKVLDVMCYHLSGSEEAKPITPAFLSGSQRFRVAVALALGIGRTAARGTNGRAARVETILIDEGFGALDKTGRDEMKDELRELGRELGRVILVSHQEDFARAFPNRFNITMDNGVSRVQKVVE